VFHADLADLMRWRVDPRVPRGLVKNALFVDSWWRALPLRYRQGDWLACPVEFPVVVYCGQNNDLCFFPRHTIHGYGPATTCTEVQTRVFLQVGVNLSTPVEQAEAWKPNGCHADGHTWESYQSTDRLSNDNVTFHLRSAQRDQVPPFMQISAHLLALYRRTGLLCLVDAPNGAHHYYHTEILNYTERLLQLPDNFSLSRAEQASCLICPHARTHFQMPDHYVRRDAQKRKTAHFSKGSGLSGLGFYSNAVRALTHSLMVYVQKIFQTPSTLLSVQYTLSIPLFPCLKSQTRQLEKQTKFQPVPAQYKALHESQMELADLPHALVPAQYKAL
jgi:hypothetical protein